MWYDGLCANNGKLILFTNLGDADQVTLAKIQKKYAGSHHCSVKIDKLIPKFFKETGTWVW